MDLLRVMVIRARSTQNVLMTVLLGALYCIFVAGCDGGASAPSSTTAPGGATQPSDGHDHDHDHAHESPKSLAEAVSHLEAMRNTIRDAFAKNDSESAHGPLHEVGHMLEAVLSLSSAADLKDDQKAAVKQSVEQLFGHFGKVDELLHGEKGSKYEDVSSKIDEAVKTLADLVAGMNKK